MTNWYYMIMGETRGPVDEEDLKQLAHRGEVTPDTPVRKGEEGTPWQTADHFSWLFNVEQLLEDTADEPASPPARLRSLNPHSLLRPPLPPENRFPVLSAIGTIYRVAGFLLFMIGVILLTIGVIVCGLLLAQLGHDSGSEAIATLVSVGIGFLWTLAGAVGCFLVSESIRVVLAIEKNTWTVTQQMADLFSYQATLHRQMEDLRRRTV